MDNLFQAAIQKQLISLKRRLKSWETAFEQKEGRRPTKDDISESSIEVKAMYKNYRDLKSQHQAPNSSTVTAEELKQSRSISDKDSVFGSFLNKKKKASADHHSASAAVKSSQEKARKWIKGVGHRTVSIHEGDDVATCKLPCVGLNETLQLDTVTRERFDDVLLQQDNLKIIDKTKQDKIPSRYSTTGHYDSCLPLTAQKPRLRHISDKWLDHCRPQLDSSMTTQDQQLSSKQHNISHLPSSSTPSIIAVLEGRLDRTALYSTTRSMTCEADTALPEDTSSCDNITKVPSTSELEVTSVIQHKPIVNSVVHKLNLSTTLTTNITSTIACSKEQVVGDSSDSAPGDRPLVCESVVSNIKKLTDNGEEEGRWSIIRKQENVTAKSKDSGKVEMESVSLKTVQPKRSSSAVSNNFVRLNMKVRRYSKKTGRVTGSRYKRLQWKKLREEREGPRARAGGKRVNVCFKCGKPGHWARNCTDKGGYDNLGSFGGEKVEFCDEEVEEEEDEDFDRLLAECPFPSVEETVTAEQGKKETTSLDPGPSDQVSSLPLPDITLPPSETLLPTPTPVEPLLPPDKDGKVPESAPSFVMSALNTLGYQEFRTGQEAAVLRVLAGVSTLMIQPTGSGKSLCYQLPAYLYSRRSPCLTLVVSPLISLMEDQILNMPAELKGACLHTNKSTSQRDKIINDVMSGNINVLLLSPESLVSMVTSRGRSLWGRGSTMPPIAFACIDEAHCLSEWSHNFRPSYLRLHQVLKHHLGVSCILALTATATMTTVHSITDLLGIASTDVLRGTTIPDNLHITVSSEINREKALVELLQSAPFVSCSSIIIYCTRQQTTDRVAQLLRTALQDLDSGYHHDDDDDDTETPPTTGKGKGVKRSLKGGRGTKRRKKLTWNTECYHAGLSAYQRRSVQSNFMTGKLRIVVATVAFGMGLNKSDVRAVIHYNMPKSFESFVQEIGRAGRDELPAFCHVLTDEDGEDLYELRRHSYSSSVDHFTVKQLVQKSFLNCQCDRESRSCPGHEVAVPIEPLVQSLDTREEALATLLCYLQLAGWLEVLSPINDSCIIRCYGGMGQLRALAKKLPPIRIAIAQQREGIAATTGASLKISLTQAARKLGCDSATIRYQLQGLAYNDCGTSQGLRSSVTVEWTDLSFHFNARGDLTDKQKDTICHNLLEKVKKREEKEIEKLHLLYTTLCGVATGKQEVELKSLIQEYFDDNLTINALQCLGIETTAPINRPVTDRKLSQLQRDIGSLVSNHTDQQLTGRAVARILHGIPSPCYPAEVWGKAALCWRKHLDVDFNLLCQLATKQLLGQQHNFSTQT